MSQPTGSTCSVSTATRHCRQRFLSPILSACCCFDAILLACLPVGDKEWRGSDKAKLNCVGPGTCMRAVGHGCGAAMGLQWGSLTSC